MDWRVVLLLAAVTWLEGVRRVAADALVLRRVLGGAWTAVDSVDTADSWRLVSWWTPLTLGLVVSARAAAGGAAQGEPADERLETRLARVGRTVAALRALGAAVLLGIVLGVPAAVARFGAWGFGAGLASVLLLALGTAAVTMRGLRILEQPWRRAGRVAFPLLWPFAAPRAAEVLLEQAVDGAPPLAVARHLLGETRFAAWVRPQAYDALSGDSPDVPAAVLTLLGRTAVAAIVQAPPASCGPGESFCARCARTYRAGVTKCAECDVELSSASVIPAGASEASSPRRVIPQERAKRVSAGI